MNKKLARRIAEAVAKKLYPRQHRDYIRDVAADEFEPIIAAELPPECEAAPELLEACERLVAHIHDSRHDHNVAERWEAMRQAERAIAHAKGANP